MPKAKEFLNIVNEKVSEASVLKKVKEMIKEDQAFLLERCKKYLNSGAIEAGNYGDDFRLPKILLYTALADLRDQRRPLGDEDLKTAKNLSNF